MVTLLNTWCVNYSVPLKTPPRGIVSSFLILVTWRQEKGHCKRHPFLPPSRTLTEAPWRCLALMYFPPSGCGLTLPGLMKAEGEIRPSWLPIFPSHLCQLLAGTHPRFCRISRQASSDEYAGMQSRVRKSSNLKDLKCHQIPTTPTLPSGCPASPERRYIPRQPVHIQTALTFRKLVFIPIWSIFPVAYIHHLS